MYDYPVWQALKWEGEGEFERMRARGACEGERKGHPNSPPLPFQMPATQANVWYVYLFWIIVFWHVFSLNTTKMFEEIFSLFEMCRKSILDLSELFPATDKITN